MGLCKTSNVSIFTFTKASDLKFAHVLTAAVSYGERSHFRILFPESSFMPVLSVCLFPVSVFPLLQILMFLFVHLSTRVSFNHNLNLQSFCGVLVLFFFTSLTSIVSRNKLPRTQHASILVI